MNSAQIRLKHHAIIGQTLLRAVGIVLVGLAVGPLLHAQTIWTAGSGNWATGSNWSAGVPDSSTNASITNGGTATISSSSEVASLTLGGASTGGLSITGGGLATAGTTIVGANGATGTGTASISASTWSTAGDFFVGYFGNGSLTVSGGNVTVANNSYVGYSGTSTATVSGGNWTTNGTLYVGTDSGGGSGRNGTLTISSGTVSAAVTQLATDGTAVGTLNLNGGVLATGIVIEHTGSNGGTVNFNGGTLRVTQNQTSLFTDFETGDIQIAAGGATIDTQAFDVGVSTVMQGVGGLTKTGSGILTLTGAQAYTGTTAVSAGTLLVNGSIASGSSVVVSGGTLGGTGTINSATTIQSGGTLAPGASPGVLTFSNGLTLASGSATNFEINGDTRGTTYDGINLSAGLLTYGGTLNLSFGQTFVNGTTLDLFQLSGSGSSGSFSSIAATGSYTGALSNSGGTWTYYNGSQYVIFTQSTGDLTFSAIPEPSAYAAIVGLGSLGFVMWRRRRAAAVAATS
ncbi:MAG: autotransporter-associated beta strand repeat-containing protein [Candidatus Didemnitutus sp.]|nr:autotransporter-associated beta strand repeat-containing protein [Candidatus Didemnitutus sp.]